MSGGTITVEARDAVGNPAAGAVVSVQLPNEGPSGRFTNGMTTDLATTAADGRAVFRDLQWDAAGPAISIRVNAMKDGVRAAVLAERAGEKRTVLAASAPALSIAAAQEPTAEPKPPFPPRPGPAAVSAANEDDGIPVYSGGGGWGKRLLVIAAIAGAAVATGYAVQSRQAASAARGAATPPVAGANVVPPQPAFSIGAPVINVGRP